MGATSASETLTNHPQTETGSVVNSLSRENVTESLKTQPVGKLGFPWKPLALLRFRGAPPRMANRPPPTQDEALTETAPTEIARDTQILWGPIPKEVALSAGMSMTIVPLALRSAKTRRFDMQLAGAQSRLRVLVVIWFAGLSAWVSDFAEGH